MNFAKPTKWVNKSSHLKVKAIMNIPYYYKVIVYYVNIQYYNTEFIHTNDVHVYQ
jgi:hypothetical protein